MTRRSLIAAAAAAALPAQQATRLPRKIHLALLGLDGHINEVLGPLPRLPDVEVVALSDPDPKAIARLARNLRVAKAAQYADYHRMLDQEKLDMVAVCGPNGPRAAAILACIERSLHVIAEKPLATERADLEHIRQAVAHHKVQVSMLLPMRYSSPYLALKKIADSGELGEVAQISAQKSYKLGERAAWMHRRSTYGGTIPWIGIHMVDLMRWSSGREFTDAASFQARVGNPELGDMENTTGTVFRLDNGGVATLHMDYYRPETAPTHGDDRLRLAGTKGVAEYMAATGVTLMSSGRKPEVVGDLPPARSLFVEFLESVYYDRRSSLPLADIYRVNEIVLLARESAERRAIVKL